MINFIYKCIFFVILMVEVINCQESSCSTNIPIFKEKDNYYAWITVPVSNYHDDNALRLEAALLIANTVISNQDLTNKLLFFGSLEDIIHKRPLVFRLEFPPRINIPPIITRILINKQILCVSESKIDSPLVKTISKVNLASTLVITTFSNSDQKISTMKPNNINKPHSMTPNLNNIYSNNNNNFQHKMRTTEPSNIFYTNYPSVSNPNEWNPNSQIKNKISNYPVSRNPVKPVTNNHLDSCGKTKMSSIQLIANGDTVQTGDRPWIGALFLKKSSENPMYLCGASLITKKLALTAGHCIADYFNSELYLIFGRIGVNDWLNENDQKTKVQKTELHPNYNGNDADADIAILHLGTELRITSTVNTVCLWETKSDLKDIVGQTGLVVGWGQNENYKDPQELQEVYLRVVSEEECLRSSEGFTAITSSRTFCAGNNNNTGPCNGDSGSGFYFFVNQRWTIRGIVSRSLQDLSGRCDISKYSVYTDVAKHIEWIRQFL